ncbi:DUF4956 domain-containing protein [Telmatocola sphagniphila]|jgi:hypothetical protein|uniref:DUF4956 domain-containing protein n=1 Tax=Telmatocola sphagniphila TaxID=1123043 RepID=A0A8E6BB41_9BACT|nr:DUF4956 domain-containing protein [Telmatocola sphagniphila]QVL34614.1 DUF4956 domain-containing protein [Telmatocola sphagniphila]
MDDMLKEGSEFVSKTIHTSGKTPLELFGEMFEHLGAAFILGATVAGIAYFSHYRGRAIKSSLLAMLVMMSVLIAMVTLVIGNSLARAFSLAGVLAIIRFRTVIEDTRDTAFVIAAVAMGLAAGAGFYIVAVVTLPFLFLTTWIFRTGRPPRRNGEIIEIRQLASEDPKKSLEPLLEKHALMVQLISMDRNGKGTHIELQYALRMRETGESIKLLMGELQTLSFIQKVKLKQRKDN